MNQKTLLTIAVLAGVGLLGYYLYKSKTSAPASAPATGGMAPPAAAPGLSPNDLSAYASAGANALSSLSDMFGF